MPPFEFFVGISIGAIAVFLMLIFIELSLITKALELLRDLMEGRR